MVFVVSISRIYNYKQMPDLLNLVKQVKQCSMYTVKMTLSIYQFDLFFIQTWYIVKYLIIEKLNENVRSSHGPASTSFSMASSFHLV